MARWEYVVRNSWDDMPHWAAELHPGDIWQGFTVLAVMVPADPWTPIEVITVDGDVIQVDRRAEISYLRKVS